MIAEIRKLTGLSHQQLASWLGVSRTMVQFAENYERSLTGEASHKLTLLALPLEEVKAAAQSFGYAQEESAAPLPCSNPAAFAGIHKKKMNDHLYLAEGLRLKLGPLLKRHRQLVNSLALLDAMQQLNGQLYRSTAADKKIAGEFRQENEKALNKLVEKIELLQVKLETHLAYAALHSKLYEKFEGMRKKQQ